jgi:hypothetical protein
VVDKKEHDGEAPPLDTAKQRPPPAVLSKWEEVLQAIDSALDRLNFLASAIRKASVKRLQYNVASFLTDEDIIFRRDATSLLKWKFPQARKSLCEQLGDSIAVRRKMLFRTTRHAEKLTVKRTVKQVAWAEQKHTSQLNPQAAGGQVNAPTNSKADGPFSTITHASRPAQQALVFRHLSGPTKPALSSSISSVPPTPGDLFQYPDPPEAKEGERDTKCSYCLKPFNAAKLKLRNNEQWRLDTHKPYTRYVSLIKYS